MGFLIFLLLPLLTFCPFGNGESINETPESPMTEEELRGSFACERPGEQCASADNCCSNICDKEEGAMAGRCGRSETGGSCKGVWDCQKCRKPGKLCITTCTNTKCTCRCTKCVEDADCAPCTDSQKTPKCLPSSTDGPYDCQCA